MKTPYSNPYRISSDQGGSVNHGIAYAQEGIAASKIATAYTFIPCDIQLPHQVFLTPVKLGTTSANGVAFFTTTGGWQVDSFDTFSAVADLDAHAASVAYEVGTIVKATPTGGALGAYVCVEAHTSTAGPDFDADLASGYWQLLSTTTFLKITHTSAGSGKVANFHYKIEGYLNT